jgi:hypothetical protein
LNALEVSGDACDHSTDANTGHPEHREGRQKGRQRMPRRYKGNDDADDRNDQNQFIDLARDLTKNADASICFTQPADVGSKLILEIILSTKYANLANTSKRLTEPLDRAPALSMRRRKRV